MRLIITRPEEDSQAWRQNLPARGHEAIVAPLHAHRAAPAVLAKQNYQAIALTSANALRAPALSPPPDWLIDCKVFAVGAQSWLRRAGRFPKRDNRRRQRRGSCCPDRGACAPEKGRSSILRAPRRPAISRVNWRTRDSPSIASFSMMPWPKRLPGDRCDCIAERPRGRRSALFAAQRAHLDVACRACRLRG